MARAKHTRIGQILTLLGPCDIQRGAQPPFPAEDRVDSQGLEVEIGIGQRCRVRVEVERTGTGKRHEAPVVADDDQGLHVELQRGLRAEDRIDARVDRELMLIQTAEDITLSVRGGRGRVVDGGDVLGRVDGVRIGRPRGQVHSRRGFPLHDNKINRLGAL